MSLIIFGVTAMVSNATYHDVKIISVAIIETNLSVFMAVPLFGGR